MLSPELENQIFVALPSTFMIGDMVIPVHKERSALARVSAYLEKHPNSIYMVIDYSDDEVFRQETPMNYWYGEPAMGDKVGLIRGTRNQISLDVHLYMVYTVLPNYRPGLMEQVLGQMQRWVLFELEKLVDYPRVGSIQAIDQTQDRLIHRVISCTFVYTDTFVTMIDPIKTIEYEVQKVSPPPLVVVDNSVDITN